MNVLPPIPPFESDNGLPERWYLPTWPERFGLMKWRLVYIVPVLFLLLLLIFIPWALFWWWKLLVIATALPLTAAYNAAHHAIRLRKEPFCIHCGYDLTGLPDGHVCPECGFAFHHAEIDDYRRDPHWFIQRRRLNRNLPPAAVVFEAGPKRRPKKSDGT